MILFYVAPECEVMSVAVQSMVCQSEGIGFDDYGTGEFDWGA